MVLSLTLNQPIDAVTENSSFNRKALTGLAPADRKHFEVYGKGSTVQLPYHMIHHAIECQALKQENAIAAEHKQQQITYGELNRQADDLAAELLGMGIGPGDNVGLFLERSIAMLVGILGVLKAGAAYVPQDVRITPAPSLLNVMGAADIKVIVTLSSMTEKIPADDHQTVLAIDHPARGQISGNNPMPITVHATTARPDDNCFILFTSGTTGTPNGVQVTHSNVCNILLPEPGCLGIQPGYKVSQLLNIAFDLAAWEVLGCLAHGGTLVIRENDFTQAAQQCDVIIATPSILAKIDSELCHSVKTVAVAGESCPKPLAEKWAAKCRFINSYGPTETTIINTAQHYRPRSLTLTIGKPTPNNTVYVLNEYLQPCDMGEVGEIWAGGVGVSAGYINNEPLTQERYRPDPFLANGSLMFRTRDLGRWNNEGELEHWGRTDEQVKIKGFRVELDSVSTVAESVGSCQQAVTLKVANDQLVTFVTPTSVDTQRCMEAIGERLPYYCLPSAIIALPEFPMTARGKTDKQTLLEQIRKKNSRSLSATEKAGAIG